MAKETKPRPFLTFRCEYTYRDERFKQLIFLKPFIKICRHSMFQVYPRDPASLKMALLIKTEKMFTGSPQPSGWRVELNCFWAKVIECLNANMETSLKIGCQGAQVEKRKAKAEKKNQAGKKERVLVSGGVCPCPGCRSPGCLNR